MNKSEAFGAAETKQYNEVGDFFRLMDAAFAVTVVFYYQGREVYRAEDVNLGYWERFRAGLFDRFTIYSATAQTVQFASRLGSDVGWDRPPTGDVNIANSTGPFTQGRTAVGSGAAVQLMAANTLRRRLIVQNNTTAQYLRVTLDGSAPTAANGLRLIPGDLLDLADYCPSGAVRAIFESGAAADVEWSEG